MKHIKLFENFSREYLKTNNNSLTDFYFKKLQDFSLEDTVLTKLAEYETKIDELFSDGWNLNRGRSRYNASYNGDYFALNVKVHVWVDTDTVKDRVGIELDEERLSDLWYRWLQDQAEMFEEDIKESYNWVDKIGWGGNSGGWLHIYPDAGADTLLEYAEEEIQSYLDTKEGYDEDELEAISHTINSPEWQRLAELGLADDEDAVKEVTTKLNECIEYLETKTKELITIEQDLRSIQRQHKEFENTAERYFLEFLEEEITDGHLG